MIWRGSHSTMPSSTGRSLRWTNAGARRFSFSRTEPQPRVAARYYAFDLVYVDGIDLRRVPLGRRLALLDLRVVRSGHVQAVGDYFPEDGIVVYEAALAQGLEGVVAKQRTSTYEAG